MKQWMLVAVAVVLGGLSLYLNKDWFAREDIQIYDRSRPARASFFRRKPSDNVEGGDAVNPIVFGFDRKLKLTSLKVVPDSDIETNKYPHPIWDLISDSNSVPIKTFAYGMSIQGMRPSVPGAIADPLEPGVKYRLLIEAGTAKAKHDFVPSPRTP